MCAFCLLQRYKQHNGLTGRSDDRQSQRQTSSSSAEPTEHGVVSQTAGRLRQACVQTLRLQEESQPRPQQPKHDRRQRNHVSTCPTI